MRLRHLYNNWVSPQRWLERAGVRAPMQIVFGLVLLTNCVILFAQTLGLLPNPGEATLQKRQILAESASSEAASAIAHGNYAMVRDSFDVMVRRYPEVRSLGLRQQNGSILIETAGHDKFWDRTQTGANTPTHVRVVLYEGQKPWGELEIAFAPLEGPTTWHAWWQSPPVRLTIFILAGVFILFWLFLSRMLRTLDPSAAVPERMQLMMDTLVEGMVILDEKDQIVMANESFARTAFLPLERLIGRTLSSLPWQSENGEGAPDLYPWRAAEQSNLRQRSVSMRLQIGSRHTRRLSVNASPIPGPDGAHLGVLVTFNDQTAVEAENLQMSQIVARFGDASESVRQLREQLESHADHGQLAQLEELAAAAREIAGICQTVTPVSSAIDENDLATKAANSTKDDAL
jgi:PAS domain S-box-containing protein